MISHADVGYAQKGGGDYGDVSPVPLGSKESHDPPTVTVDPKSYYKYKFNTKPHIFLHKEHILLYL